MQPNVNAVDKTRVFVVHGRNEELRKSMFDFLRSIGLKPIEWTQAIQMTGNASPFIGDILDAAFQQAQAVIVLLNGDDEARLCPEHHSDKMPDYEKYLTPQARPNVLFEAGLALGRFPNRTIIVEVGDLRPFSDIAGRHTIRLSNSTKARQDLAQRLSISGCLVDLSGTDWHHTGNFSINNKVDDVVKLSGILANDINIKMHPIEIIILQQLAKIDGKLEAGEISNSIKTDIGLVKNFLESLVERGYVVRKDWSTFPSEYSITKKGFDFLVQIGKI